MPASTSRGRSLDATKANYAHAHTLLAASSAVAAGLPGADSALAAAAAAIDQHFWSDAEGCARESWNADFTELEPYRGANSNMHSVEAYLAAADVTGNPVWLARAASIATRLIDGQARAQLLAGTRALRRELAAPAGLQRTTAATTRSGRTAPPRAIPSNGPGCC